MQIDKQTNNIVGTTRVEDAHNLAKLRRTDLIQLYRGDAELLPVLAIGCVKEII